MSDKIIVAGLGEIGRPLFELIGTHFDAVGIDKEQQLPNHKCNIFHVCFPFAIDDFVGTCLRYAERFDPSLIIINSTVAPGTSRTIGEITGKAVVNSPVRGKHTRMKEDLLHYTKFVGGIDPKSSQIAAEHFNAIGLKTKILSSPEATELAKLTETTYFGHIIAFAQEVARYCESFGVGYDEVVSFYTEISFFPPVKYIPGVIGGHCVMPNISILREVFSSSILDAIEESNEMKKSSRPIERRTESKRADALSGKP